jgi:hypothetical protein
MPAAGITNGSNRKPGEFSGLLFFNIVPEL